MDREEPLPPCTTTEAHPGSPAQDPALENSRLHFPRPYVLQPADPQSRASTPGPRPRLIKQPKSVIPTTRTTSWRAGSRDHARPENPVLAGACRRFFQTFSLGFGLGFSPGSWGLGAARSPSSALCETSGSVLCFAFSGSRPPRSSPEVALAAAACRLAGGLPRSRRMAGENEPAELRFPRALRD